MSRISRQQLTAAVACGLGITVLANLLFSMLMIAVQGNQSLIIDRIRSAFTSGDLGITNRLFFDSRRGWHQYNDCNVLQMLANDEPSRLNRAFAPKIYYANEKRNSQCAVLRALFVEGVDRNTLGEDRYARYWHGYNVIGAVGLRFMELRSLRRVLSTIVWFSIALLLLVTYRARAHTRRTGLIISVVAGTFWAVPFFAPGFTHGPGDAAILFGLSAIATWPKITRRLIAIVPFAAGFGAIIVFFEMLTAQLPIAIAWLIAMVLALGRDNEQTGDVAPPVAAFTAALAFTFGAVVTVLGKQIIAILLVEPEAGAVFFSRLAGYTGLPESQGSSPAILLPFISLLRASRILTFGNTWLSYGLTALTGLIWLAAAVKAFWTWRTDYGRDVLILLCAALLPVAWVLVWSNHTVPHANFMVRMFVVTISIAPLALSWPFRPSNIDSPAISSGRHAGTRESNG